MEDVQGVLNLIKCIRKYPLLYDNNEEEYYNKALQRKTWNFIAAQLHLNVVECKEKWKNIKADLNRHIKNQYEDDNDVTKSKRPYYLAQYLDFLIPICKTCKRNVVHANLKRQNMKDTSRCHIHTGTYSNQTPAKKIRTEISSTSSKLEAGEIDTVMDIGDLNFLKSLHPYMQEMTIKQKLTFQISTLQLIDHILTESPN